jgi:hypothetical protein
LPSTPPAGHIIDIPVPKPFLLFSMSGVLVKEREFQPGRSRDNWVARPGIEALLKLADKCVRVCRQDV